MHPLQNKVVVTAGASSGIGAATARKLADLGASIVVRYDKLKTLTAQLGNKALYVCRGLMRPLLPRAVRRLIFTWTWGLRT